MNGQLLVSFQRGHNCATADTTRVQFCSSSTPSSCLSSVTAIIQNPLLATICIFAPKSCSHSVSSKTTDMAVLEFSRDCRMTARRMAFIAYFPDFWGVVPDFYSRSTQNETIFRKNLRNAEKVP